MRPERLLGPALISALFIPAFLSSRVFEGTTPIVAGLALLASFVYSFSGNQNKWIFRALVLAICLAITQRAGLLTGGELAFADTPYHFYLSQELWDSLGRWEGIQGFTDAFHFGYPPFFDLPPLFYFLAGIPSRILPAISPEASFRAVASLAFFLAALGVFEFSRKAIALNEKDAFVASLLFIASSHHIFENGVFHAYLSLGLFLSAGALLFKDGGAKFSPSASAVFALSLLSHPTIFLSGAVFLIPLAFKSALTAAFENPKKLALFALVFFLIAFPYLLEVASGREYSASSWAGAETFFPELISPNEISLGLSPYPHLLAIALAGAILLLIPNRLSGEGGSRLPKATLGFVLVILLFTLGRILRLAGAENLGNFLVPERVLFVAFSALSIVSAGLLSKIASGTGTAGKVVAFLPAGIGIAFYLSYLLSAWHCPDCSGSFDSVNRPLFEERIGGLFGKWYSGNSPKDGIFSSEKPAPVKEAERFLLERASCMSRTVIEESSKVPLGRWIAPGLRTATGAIFAGGPPIYLGKTDSNIIDGKFLGKPVSEYSPSEFLQANELANSEYLIVQTPEFKEYLQSLPEEFERELETSEWNNATFSIFRRIRAERTYAIPGENASTISCENGKYEFSARGDFTALLRNSPSLVAITPEGDLLRISDGPLGTARIDVPEGYSGRVSLYYKGGLAQRVAPIVFLAGLALAALLGRISRKVSG